MAGVRSAENDSIVSKYFFEVRQGTTTSLRLVVVKVKLQRVKGFCAGGEKSGHGGGVPPWPVTADLIDRIQTKSITAEHSSWLN